MEEVFQNTIRDFAAVADIKHRNDVLFLALHTYMIDIGFIPKFVSEHEKLKVLPKNWQEGGVCRIVYYHHTCPELSCLMSCIPLDHLLSIFGTSHDDSTTFQAPSLCLNVNHYVKKGKISDPPEAFIDERELRLNFKDNFAFALLAEMQNALGFGPTFGLSVVPPHVKMEILRYLPVHSFVSMSATSKEFHQLCNFQSLWKDLFIRDSSVVAVQEKEKTNLNWKEMYKVYYRSQKRIRAEMVKLNRMERALERGQLCPPQLPRIAHLFPDRAALPPEVAAAFPQLGLRRNTNQLPVLFPGHSRNDILFLL